MKVIELTQKPISLERLLEMAGQETVILRQANQKEFVLSAVDDFDLEVELLRQNKEFMAYLDELSAQQATIPLEEVERMLDL
jgi:hypothetical protein